MKIADNNSWSHLKTRVKWSEKRVIGSQGQDSFFSHCTLNIIILNDHILFKNLYGENFLRILLLSQHDLKKLKFMLTLHSFIKVPIQVLPQAWAIASPTGACTSYWECKTMIGTLLGLWIMRSAPMLISLRSVFARLVIIFKDFFGDWRISKETFQVFEYEKSALKVKIKRYK